VAWDGRQLADWWHELDGALAVVNLAGRSVNCRYHARNRDLMMRSRVEPTRLLGEAIARCAAPPRIWLNSSTATIYKHSLDRPMDEATGVIGGTPEVKDEFSIEVATAWEKVFDEAVTPRTRKVALRTAMVFSNTPGTVYRVLRRLVRLGLGGPMAGGGQYVSWIHERDFCRAVEWLIEHEDFTGPRQPGRPAPADESGDDARDSASLPCTVRPAGNPPDARDWGVLPADGNRADHQEPPRGAGPTERRGVHVRVQYAGGGGGGIGGAETPDRQSSL
jgi:uncharacterized protein (TIGR01777 family)